MGKLKIYEIEGYNFTLYPKFTAKRNSAWIKLISMSLKEAKELDMVGTELADSLVLLGNDGENSNFLFRKCIFAGQEGVDKVDWSDIDQPILTPIFDAYGEMMVEKKRNFEKSKKSSTSAIKKSAQAK